MVGNGSFRALLNCHRGLELKINVSNQWKRDQASNLAPQSYAHVKVKFVLPWPTNLHFKTYIFNCVWTAREVYKTTISYQDWKWTIVPKKKKNEPWNQTPQCETHVNAKSLLPWLSKLCFKIGRYQTCMASAWVIMWQYCSQHVWEKTPSIERSCLVATLSHLDQFCKQSTSKEDVWP